ELPACLDDFRMNWHLRLGLVFAILLGVIGWLYHGLTSSPAPEAAPGRSADGAADNPSWPAPGPDAESRLNEEAQHRLQAQEERREKAEHARERMMRERSTLQRLYQPTWTALRETNWAKFEALRQKAAAGDGRTPCTLCDGFGYMPCIMCTDHNGRCVNCDGSSHSLNGQHCAACLGSGKCYLCNGRGKMLCIFCNDGRIEIDWHMPH